MKDHYFKLVYFVTTSKAFSYSFRKVLVRFDEIDLK